MKSTSAKVSLPAVKRIIKRVAAKKTIAAPRQANVKTNRDSTIEKSAQFIDLLKNHIEHAVSARDKPLYGVAGMSRRERFCQVHGFEYSYITAVLNGDRYVPRSDDNKVLVRKFAKILGVSALQILVYCGELEAEDVVVQVNQEQLVKIAYERLLQDPLMALIAPNQREWNSWGISAKLRFILLYEFAARKTLLNHATMEFSAAQIDKLSYVLDNPTTGAKTASRKH